MKADVDYVVDHLRMARELKPDGDDIGDDILATLEVIQSINDGVEEAVESLDHLRLSEEDDRERLVKRATAEVVEQISRNASGG